MPEHALLYSLLVISHPFGWRAQGVIRCLHVLEFGFGLFFLAGIAVWVVEESWSLVNGNLSFRDEVRLTLLSECLLDFIVVGVGLDSKEPIIVDGHIRLHCVQKRVDIGRAPHGQLNKATFASDAARSRRG